MIKAEIEYLSGIKEIWIDGGIGFGFDGLATELIKFDYGVYKTRKVAKYYYMGYEIHINDDLDFEDNIKHVMIQLKAINKTVKSLI